VSGELPSCDGSPEIIAVATFDGEREGIVGVGVSIDISSCGGT
jgi:hypothetical protein